MWLRKFRLYLERGSAELPSGIFENAPHVQ